MKQHYINELSSVLTELSDELSGMQSTLQAEREAIVEFDLMKIQKIQHEKQGRLRQIGSIDKKRQRLLERSQAPSMESLLADDIPEQEADQIRDQISCVKALAAAVREFNEAQQQYLAHSLAEVEGSLNLLASITGHGISAGYERDGKIDKGKKHASPLVINRSI